MIKLNLEYESKYLNFNKTEESLYEDKMLKIKNLVKLANIFSGNEEKMKKYLVSNSLKLFPF